MKYTNTLKKFVISAITTFVFLALSVDIIIIFGDLFNDDYVVNKAVKVVKKAFVY